MLARKHINVDSCIGLMHMPFCPFMHNSNYNYFPLIKIKMFRIDTGCCERSYPLTLRKHAHVIYRDFFDFKKERQTVDSEFLIKSLMGGGYPNISRKNGMYEGMHFMDILPSYYVRQYAMIVVFS